MTAPTTSGPAPCWALRDAVTGEDLDTGDTIPHWGTAAAADLARVEYGCGSSWVPVQLDRPCVESVSCVRCHDKPDPDTAHHASPGDADQEAIDAGWTHTADGWLCAYEDIDGVETASLPAGPGPGQDPLW